MNDGWRWRVVKTGTPEDQEPIIVDPLPDPIRGTFDTACMLGHGTCSCRFCRGRFNDLAPRTFDEAKRRGLSALNFILSEHSE